MLTLILIFISVSYLLKVSRYNRLHQTGFLNSTLSIILGFFISFTFLSLTTLYYTLDLNITFSTPLFYLHKPLLFDYQTYNFLLNTQHLGIYLTSVYSFPYVYIFVVITVLSVLFCLAYNHHETSSFMLYCLVILLAGYLLFFTSSLTLFFFAYEMLLIPSFFILYNFAKTRRCVESAYLMFFWTQFGALFLIFAFLYLFFLTGTSSFSSLADLYLTTYELNFVFFCLLFGFGVKLPI
jgi:formate hydrogenlyase subunit 3/multisubunit Na+/H+ antiporter MnhD subunit